MICTPKHYSESCFICVNVLGHYSNLRKMYYTKTLLNRDNFRLSFLRKRCMNTSVFVGYIRANALRELSTRMRMVHLKF